MSDQPYIEFGRDDLDFRAIARIARKEAGVALSRDGSFREEIAESRRSFEQIVRDGEMVYGVTTGFGENCITEIASDDAHDLAQNLYRFHGCGTGDVLDAEHATAVLAVRLKTLCHGHSAVRWELLEQIEKLINHSVIPVIPERGSVGASGDLTPLSYVAAVINGGREVWWNGEIHRTASVFEEVGLTPFDLGPKESLAVMNGTSVMTALAAMALVRAEGLVRLGAAITACISDVCGGNASHFDARIFAAKPFEGQARVAELVRSWLEYDPERHVNPDRIQDRYSIRCAPHVIGVLADALLAFGPWVDIELNSANDNPLFDAETSTVLHGGNFYGGHMAFAMDSLKSSIASVADLMDRQMQLLCQPALTGLPANLVPDSSDSATRHGFKAMSIATSAIAAEVLHLTVPVASFSRSTESHNQDKVSMGTISSRYALRSLSLAEEVTAILLIACAQAAELRGLEECRPATRHLHSVIRQMVDFTDADRRHDHDIRRVYDAIASDLDEQIWPDGGPS